MIKKDDIKTFVIVMIVSIVCIGIVLIINIKNNSDRLMPVNDYNNYFANIGYINKYINLLSNSDSLAIYDLLDKKYIKDYNITLDNVFDKIKKYPLNSSISVTDMDYVQIGNNFLYYVKGDIYTLGYNNEELVDDDFAVLLISDYKNLSFSIYPASDNYKKIINSIKKINIEKNDNNELKGHDSINKERVCSMYLSNFLNVMDSDIDKSYDLLSDEMKKEYTTIDSYRKYVSDNKDNFSTTASMCKVDNYDDKRVYSVIDEKGNRFVFDEEYILNYKVSFYLNNNSE